MIHKLLAWWGVALCDLELVARILAADTLRAHAGHVGALNEATTRRELCLRYVRVALEVGLPDSAAPQVAKRAWAHIAAAQVGDPPLVGRGFRFFE